MVAPIAASVMQMALSRSREFEADRGGAELLGDPRPLASALAKLDATSRRVPMDISPQQATAYIVNPLTGRQVSFAKMFLTHPPIEERIEQLMQMRPRRPARHLIGSPCHVLNVPGRSRRPSTSDHRPPAPPHHLPTSPTPPDQRHA